MTVGDRSVGVRQGEPLRSPDVPGGRDPVRRLRENSFAEAKAAGPLEP